VHRVLRSGNGSVNVLPSHEIAVDSRTRYADCVGGRDQSRRVWIPSAISDPGRQRNARTCATNARTWPVESCSRLAAGVRRTSSSPAGITLEVIVRRRLGAAVLERRRTIRRGSVSRHEKSTRCLPAQACEVLFEFRVAASLPARILRCGGLTDATTRSENGVFDQRL
jgi:hypothetical protein